MHEPTIHLSGNLAAKPQLRPVETPNGPVVVANLRVAVTPRRKGRDPQEWNDGETIWFNVSAWRSTAQNCVASLNQGDRVVVRGRLSQRTWKDAEGLEHPSLEVEADDVGLDLSRHAALSLRRPTPLQRPEQTGDTAASAGDDPWARRSAGDGGIDAESDDLSLGLPDEAAAAHSDTEPAPV